MDDTTGNDQQSPIVADAEFSMADFAKRLENVLTRNHNAFMNELSHFERSLTENLNTNQDPRSNNNTNNNTNNSFNTPVTSQSAASDRSASVYNAVRIDKWNITYDGSQDVNEFLFKINTLKDRSNCPSDLVFASFHTFLKGKAESWFWLYLKQNPNCTYDELKKAIKKQFGRQGNDYDKIVKIIERRQLPKEAVDDFFSEMERMNASVEEPMNSNKMIDLLMSNVRESIGSLIFSLDLFSLDHLKESARKAERYLSRQHEVKKRFVTEIEIHKEIDTSSDIEAEVSALKYQGFQNRERKEFDTSKFRCWNCDQIGHSWYDCPSESRNLFCYSCGRKNVSKVNCQCRNHSKNNIANE